MYNNIWIALVKVVPFKANTILGDCEGAYTNIIVKSSNRNSAVNQIKLCVEELQCRLVETDTLEKLNNRLRKFEVEKELLELANLVQNDGKARFGTFHTY
jgi:hypothetical protein